MRPDRFRYPARLTYASETAADDKGSVVTFRDLPEAITQGEDVQDALAMAADGLEEAVWMRIKLGEPIPAPSDPEPGEHLVSLSAAMSAKALLACAIRDAGIDRPQLATRLGWPEDRLRRMLHPDTPVDLPEFERVLAVLGKRLALDLNDAA